MGTATMGKVVVPARIENVEDALKAQRGELSAEKVRSVDVPDALVDTGATMLLLPQRMVRTLGLQLQKTRKAKGIGGTVSMPIYGTARLRVQGRECSVDVGEVSDDLPAVIGQVPLELMDWVIDMNRKQLIGNPEHGGEEMMEVY